MYIRGMRCEKNMKKKRLKYLDFIRGIAVLLVIYGHLIDVGTWATTIPDVINEANNINLPLIPSDTQNLWKFGLFLLNSASVQTAIVGVFFFFFLTGCLIPDSLERTPNPIVFLINRFFRIFPTLWVCMLCLCVTVYWLQGVVFTPARIIATLTMLYKVMAIPTISGVLWTLSIELFFYVLCAIIHKFTYKRIYFILIVTLSLVILGPFENYYLDGIITNLKWITIILCGGTFNLVKHDGWNNAKAAFHMLGVICLSFICFNIYAYRFGDNTTYIHMSTWIFAFTVFFTVLYFYTICPKWFDSKWLIPLYKLAELGFPIYLLHVAVGFPIMYSLRTLGVMPLMLPFIGAGISILIAKIISIVVEKPSINLAKRIADMIVRGEN